MNAWRNLFDGWLGFLRQVPIVHTSGVDKPSCKVVVPAPSDTMHEVVRGGNRASMTKIAFDTLQGWFAEEKCDATYMLSGLASRDPTIDHNVTIDGKSALFSAAEKEALAIYLLNYGAETGSSAFFEAVRNGNIFLVKLFHQEGVDLDTREEESQSTALLIACTHDSSGSEAVVEYLCAQGCDVEASGPEGVRPLHFALYTGRLSIVKLLRGKGADLEAIDERKKIALHYACEFGKFAIADYLCLQGSNIEALDCNAKTPLMYAASSGCLEAVELLCDKGASIEDKNVEGLNALMYASRDGQESVVSSLCQRGVKIGSQDYYGRTPLMHASRQGRSSIVSYLCSQGAKIETKDDQGLTALLHAAKKGHPGSAQALCDRGANTEDLAASEEGMDMNALMVACASDNAHLVQILCRQGANINAHDAKGYTALMHACKGGHARIVQLLCSRGAQVLARATDGKTAYQRIDDKNPNKNTIVRILNKHNPEVNASPAVIKPAP